MIDKSHYVHMERGFTVRKESFKRKRQISLGMISESFDYRNAGYITAC